MYFIIKSLVLTNGKDKTYDLIFVIINQLIKIIYYKLMKVTINTSGSLNIMVKIIV